MLSEMLQHDRLCCVYMESRVIPRLLEMPGARLLEMPPRFSGTCGDSHMYLNYCLWTPLNRRATIALV